MTRDDIRLVLVTGSREWEDERRLHRDLSAQKTIAVNDHKTLVIVHGGCVGADRMADSIAKNMGVHPVRCDALWASYSRNAGPLRNSLVGALFEFDEVLAYPLPGSKGTHDMVRKARKADI